MEGGAISNVPSLPESLTGVGIHGEASVEVLLNEAQAQQRSLHRREVTNEVGRILLQTSAEPGGQALEWKTPV